MTETVLEARDLTKTFTTTDPPVQVLRGVDLSVRRGEFLAVMGASGSGKSTLLHTVSGMARPTGGTVRLEGRELTGLDDAEISRLRLTRMGFVFQEAHFLRTLSIRDNVLLPALRATPDRRGEAICRVDALLERFGIAQVAGHGVTQVSGGQLQRASICRALAAGPSIVFADEPTGALNSAMTTEVMDALTEAHHRGAALVMVTHDPVCASRADRVTYLRDGLVVDERVLGAWSQAGSSSREAALLAWLGSLDF
ncbi:MAG: ABC transporter ATP-binding protein [Acidipropionibacterium sp.]|jgi:putative ABC transport system ATP-binding protein|nr:ABC transporter ATP-binding protein [Acidipropionibacterium sp.]